MKVLLSIKPEFADLIFTGIKKYEFRKTIFKNPDVKTVVVYASSPVPRVTGEFEIETILNDTPCMLQHQPSAIILLRVIGQEKGGTMGEVCIVFYDEHFFAFGGCSNDITEEIDCVKQA